MRAVCVKFMHHRYFAYILTAFRHMISHGEGHDAEGPDVGVAAYALSVVAAALGGARAGGAVVAAARLVLRR